MIAITNFNTAKYFRYACGSLVMALLKSFKRTGTSSSSTTTTGDSTSIAVLSHSFAKERGVVIHALSMLASKINSGCDVDSDLAPNINLANQEGRSHRHTKLP